jgi:hypothetical protein
MQLKYECNKSPQQMFMMGLQERAVSVTGTTGMQTEDDPLEDPNTLRVNYEALEDGALIDHMMDQDENPFADHIPDRFSEVRCEPPGCPLAPAEVEHLDATLNLEFDMSTKNLEIRKMIWDRALLLCHLLF